MANNTFLKKISASELDLNLRIFNLVIGRVLKKSYLALNEINKEKLERIFLSGDDKEKGQFIKKYIPNFKAIFETEAKKIEKEIRAEIKEKI